MKVPLKLVEGIIYSKESEEFVIQVPDIYDLHYESSRRNRILEFLYDGRKIISNFATNLEFRFLDDTDLHCYCNHPSKKRSKPVPGEQMIINQEEFLVHFLGKKEVPMNLIPNSESKVNIEDFEFLKMLGIGGFSKVYLVKKKGSNELYALKSIRLPEQRTKADKEKWKKQVKHERDILVRIKHPFIVKLKYAFQVRSRFFFVMAFIQGGELLEYIKREQKRREKV